MSYKETIEYLYSQLPMFQRDGSAAYKVDLSNTLALDRHLGHPHKEFSSIHIAGTNGKGSVAHMLAAILREAGFTTGLYTSPHLKDFRERIRVNGECIAEDAVAGFVEAHRELVEKLKPSFFEITAAMAFTHFAASGVEIAVVETGMGGRLDSTNIVIPLLSVITNIGHDHTQFLGDTPEQIAGEKAGIIKPGIPVVIGETQPDVREVFVGKSASSGSAISFADSMFSVEYGMPAMDGRQPVNVRKNTQLFLGDLRMDLPGQYQQKNLVTVLGVLEELRAQGILIGEEEIRKGLARAARSTGLRGRWEVMGHNPLTVCDTAHNQEGLEAVLVQVSQTPYKQLHIVFGMVADKEEEPLLRLLPREARYYFTRADIPRAMEAGILAAAARICGLEGRAYDSPAAALAAARNNAGKDDLILVTGSTYVVAEILP